MREGGVDAFPDVLNLLYTGGNFGKLVLKVVGRPVWLSIG